MGRLQVVPLPDGKYMLLFDQMTLLPTDKALEDWEQGRKMILDGTGTSCVLRFVERVDVEGDK